MKTQERGNTLLVSLILLLIFSLIGLSSVNNVAFNQAMASKHKDTDLAFHVAEAVLSEGEAYVESLSPSLNGDNFDGSCSGSNCFTSTCTNGRCFNGSHSEGDWCDLDEPSLPLAYDKDLWERAGSYRESEINFPGLTVKPRYIVEFLCYVQSTNSGPTPPDDINYNPTDWAYLFRVTSYAVGKDTSSKTILQSTYKVLRI